MTSSESLKRHITNIADTLGTDSTKILNYCVENQTILRLNPGNPRVSNPMKSAVLDMLARQFLSEWEWEVLELMNSDPVLMITQRKDPRKLYPC